MTWIIRIDQSKVILIFLHIVEFICMRKRIVHFSSAAQRIGVLFDVIVWLERTFIRQAHMTYQGIRLGMSAPPPENLFGHDHPKFPFQESVRNVARPRDFAWWIGGCVIDLTIFIKL